MKRLFVLLVFPVCLLAQDAPKDSTVNRQHAIQFFNAQLEQLEAQRKDLQQRVANNELEQAQIVGMRRLAMIQVDSLLRLPLIDARNIRSFIEQANGQRQNPNP